MITIPTAQLSSISFPDCLITQFAIAHSRLECHLDGIYIESHGLVDTNVCIVISNWSHIEVKRFDPLGEKATILDFDNSGKLDEICECDLGISNPFIAGFERNSRAWQHYVFTNPEILVQAEIKID